MKTITEELWRMLPVAPGLVRPYSFRFPNGRMVSFYAATPEELAAGVAGLPRGGSVYLQLNACPPFGWRPSSRDVPAIQAVLVDLDPVGEMTAREDVQLCWVKLAEIGISCDQIAIVSSGRGVQLWVLTDNAPRDLARRIPCFLRSLRDWGATHMSSCNVDTSCSDLPRLARMPGTVNPKTGITAELLFSARPGGYDWLQDFEEVPSQFPTTRAATVSDDWVDYLPYLNRAGEIFVCQGVSEGNRHQQAYACAASFRDVGAPEPVALAAVLYGAEICVPQLSAHDAQRAVKSAYRGE